MKKQQLNNPSAEEYFKRKLKTRDTVRAVAAEIGKGLGVLIGGAAAVAVLALLCYALSGGASYMDNKGKHAQELQQVINTSSERCDLAAYEAYRTAFDLSQRIRVLENARTAAVTNPCPGLILVGGGSSTYQTNSIIFVPR